MDQKFRSKILIYLQTELDPRRAAFEEEQTRLLAMLQGTIQPIKRVISTEADGTPITGEGGGAINPENSQMAVNRSHEEFSRSAVGRLSGQRVPSACGEAG